MADTTALPAEADTAPKSEAELELEAFEKCGDVTAGINKQLEALSGKLGVMIENADQTGAVLDSWLTMWRQVNEQQQKVRSATSGPGNTSSSLPIRGSTAVAVTTATAPRASMAAKGRKRSVSEVVSKGRNGRSRAASMPTSKRRASMCNRRGR